MPAAVELSVVRAPSDPAVRRVDSPAALLLPVSGAEGAQPDDGGGRGSGRGGSRRGVIGGEGVGGGVGRLGGDGVVGLKGWGGGAGSGVVMPGSEVVFVG